MRARLMRGRRSARGCRRAARRRAPCFRRSLRAFRGELRAVSNAVSFTDSRSRMNLWIFEANSHTHQECLARSLFGSNKGWPLQVRRDDICFLYNYSEKVIYGIWFADSEGKQNIETDAWGGQYRYQAKVRRSGSTIQSVPKANVWPMICQPDSGYVLNKLWGERAHNLVQHFAHIRHEGFVFGVELNA